MATKKANSTKSTTAKQPVSKKPATTKTAVAKKGATKKPATTKSTSSAPKTKALTSFRLSKDTQSFISTRITLQTIYWSILAIFILVVGIYILNVQLSILDTLQSIQSGS